MAEQRAHRLRDDRVPVAVGQARPLRPAHAQREAPIRGTYFSSQGGLLLMASWARSHSPLAGRGLGEGALPLGSESRTGPLIRIAPQSDLSPRSGER